MEKMIKTLLKAKNLNLNKWQVSLYSWIERFNIARMAIFPELIYKFNSIKTLFSQNFQKLKSKSI